MTDRRRHGARSAADDFKTLGGVSMLAHNRRKTTTATKDDKHPKSPSVISTYHRHKDVKTPKRGPRKWFQALNNCDSPNEVDMTQDIIWDPNSPSSTCNGGGVSRAVKISDLVDRIAPEDVARVSTDSPLHQWIDDSAVPCTPEVQPDRTRRKSTRQIQVEGLKELAKLFDISMFQQVREKDLTSTCNHDNQTQTPKRKQEEEQELSALFDEPTQHLDHRLSQPSSSQLGTVRPAPDPESRPRGCPGGGGDGVRRETRVMNHHDDDWDNDDLLNDPFVLEMTQNPFAHSSHTLNTAHTHTHSHTLNTAHTHSHTLNTAHTHSKKPANRRTFQLEPNSRKSKDCISTVPPLKSEEKDLWVNNTPTHSHTHTQGWTNNKQLHTNTTASTQRLKVTERRERMRVDEGRADALEEALWENKEDDNLLYQVCVDVEKNSGSQAITSDPLGPQAITSDPLGPQAEEKPLPAGLWALTPPGHSGNLARPLNRSLSTPIPTQSQPPECAPLPGWGSHPTHTGATRKLTTNSNSQNSTLKRHMSDPGFLRNKVFAPSRRPEKCSEAEIERKKQEAIAKRRLRMQFSQNSLGPT